MMKKKMVSLTLAALLALAVCSGAALAYYQPETPAAAAAEAAGPLYCHGGGHHGGRHGGHGHHGSAETCEWLFHACGECKNVNCQDEDHAHRCPADCADGDHHHYEVCRYSDGTLALVQKKA